MKIGIIVHSHTGNTLSVAEKIRENFAAQGHTVQIERVTANKEGQSASANSVLLNVPDVSPYDMIVFGAPVQAFSLSPIMGKYLKGLAPMGGKKVSCFVTQQFSKPWLGGNRAIRQMARACREKGIELSASGIVNWSGKLRDRQIEDVAARLGRVE